MKRIRQTSRKAGKRGALIRLHGKASVTALEYDSFEEGMVRGATRALFALKERGVALKLEHLVKRHPELAKRLRQ